jgi:hypothetical protein
LRKGGEREAIRARAPIEGNSPALGDRYFVSTDALVEALRGVGSIDWKQFREDVDSILDQDPTPRAWRQ